MATRDEKVRVSLEDAGFSTGMAKMAAEAAAVNAELDRMGGKSTASTKALRNVDQGAAKTKESISDLGDETDRLGRSMDTAASRTRRAESALDSYSGRVGLLGATVASLAPALGPFGAVGIGGITGLANDAGTAVLALGSLAVAFQGVGSTLQAVNKAALEPTAANLAAAQQQMDQLSPSAQKFVMQLHAAVPLLDEIKASAANGWFPGLTDALHELEPLAPTIERIFTDVGKMGGQLAAEGAKALAGPEYADFLAFIDRDAPRAMAATGKVVGSLTHGLSQLWMAFTPVDHGFNDWLIDGAKDFDQWASGLDQTEGFEHFVSYLQENGPRVAHTVSSIANALIQISEAAAPLGGPTLDIITHLADALAKIADSPLGTPLLALAQLAGTISLLTKAATAAQKVGLAGGGAAGYGLMGMVVGKNPQQTKSALGSIRQGVQGFASDLTAMYAIQSKGGVGVAKSAEDAAAMNAAWERTGATLTKVAKGGALLAGVGLVATGTADKIGLANTATLALAGSMVGPWGAAAGAVVGGYMDMKAAASQYTDQAKKAMEGMAAAGTDFAKFQANARAASATWDQMQADAKDGATSVGDWFSTAWTSVDEITNRIFGNDGPIEQAQKAAQKSEAAQRELGATFDQLYAEFHSKGPILSDWLFKPGQNYDMSDATAKQLRQIGIEANAAAPILAKWGYTWDTWAKHLKDEGPTKASDDIHRLAQAIQEADTDAGRLKNISQALSDIGEKAITSADSATELSQALSALFDPKINAVTATDSWFEGLDKIRKLAGSKGLSALTEGGRANREAIAGEVSALKERLTAMAANGAGEQKLAQTMKNSRDQILSAGKAAGLSRTQMAAFLRTLGLTPRLVKTTLKVAGATEAKKAAQSAIAQFKKLPKTVQVKIQNEGIPKSKKEAVDLAKQLNLTTKQRKVLVTLSADAAKAGVKTVDGLLDKVGKKKTNPKITVDGSSANNTINGVRSNLTRLNGQTATTYVKTVHTGGGKGSADGSRVPQDGRPYADRYPYLLAPGEFIVSNRHGQVDRNLGLLQRINMGRLANGGPVRRLADGGSALPGSARFPAQYATDVLTASFGSLAQRIKATTKELDKEQKARSSLVDRMNSLKSDVTGGLTSDLFGDTNVWSSQYGGTSLAGGISTLRGDIANAKAEKIAIAELKKKGVHGSALAAILSQGGVAGAQEYAAGSKAQLATYQRLYGVRAHVVSSAGSAAASTYSADLKAANHHLKVLTAEVKQLRNDQKHAHKQAHADRKNQADATKRGQASTRRRANGRPRV